MRFLADFQSVRNGDRVSASLDYVVGIGLVPNVGDRALLCDDEGHSAVGVVVGRRARVVDVKLDWTTWRDQSEGSSFAPIHGASDGFLLSENRKFSGVYEAVPAPRTFAGRE